MIGSTILHYNIVEKIGAGGMGEVYKAQDTKLDRFVALKFLPSNLTTNEEQKARFIQEAKTASAMNHPNICTIYSIEEYDNSKGEKQLFIAMEYIEGETLSDKKDKLSEKQKLEISIQIAEGLAAAHEKRIVHRDIKPENIMIRKDGIAQIMDFGLAKLFAEKDVSRLTKMGTTVGTLGYMSPEQIQGLDVDHRTDIFSFGVVLYEIFAGTSPFNGMHETALMYEIVNVESPPISTIKEGFDPNLDEIILECLEKDKDERRQSANELAKDLRKIKKSTGHRKSRVYNVNSKSTQFGGQPASGSSGSIAIEVFNKRIDLGKMFSSGYLSWSIALILLLLVLYISFFNNQVQQIPISSCSTILPSENNIIWPATLQISHDGKNIIYGGVDTAGNIHLWLRPVNSGKARILAKLNFQNLGFYPFWSSDDKYLFYFLDGMLKKLDVNSGTVIDICKAPSGRGGTENKNGDIVFAPNPTGGLFLVPANGGTPREIINKNPANAEESLRYPYFLPDGNHFLYTKMEKFSGASQGDMIMIGSISSDINDTVTQISSNAEYANGYLFFVKQSNLMCQKFDADNFRLSGDTHIIAENVDFENGLIQGSFSVSDACNLVFQGSRYTSKPRIVLTDNNGNIKENLFEKAFQGFWARISPDGNKIVYSALGSDNKNYDIWSYDYKRKTSTRITLNSNVDQSPIWSTNGKYIAFVSSRGKDYDLFIKNSDGTGDDSLMFQSAQFKSPTGWSSDGRYILSFVSFQKSKTDIAITDLKNNTTNFFLQTEFSEYLASLSDNMKWIMYCSDESGEYQVYVQPFGRGGGRLQLTTNGGTPMRWIDNDKAIIYQWHNNVFKIKVDGAGQNFVAGNPEKLFNMRDKNLYIYDVTRDGKTFLAADYNSGKVTPPLTYIQNWQGLFNEVGK